MLGRGQVRAQVGVARWPLSPAQLHDGNPFMLLALISPLKPPSPTRAERRGRPACPSPYPLGRPSQRLRLFPVNAGRTLHGRGARGSPFRGRRGGCIRGGHRGSAWPSPSEGALPFQLSNRVPEFLCEKQLPQCLHCNLPTPDDMGKCSSQLLVI